MHYIYLNKSFPSQIICVLLRGMDLLFYIFNIVLCDIVNWLCLSNVFSVVCWFEVFAIMPPCRNSWYSSNLSPWLFSIQRNMGCFLQNYSTGWWSYKLVFELIINNLFVLGKMIHVERLFGVFRRRRILGEKKMKLRLGNWHFRTMVWLFKVLIPFVRGFLDFLEFMFIDVTYFHGGLFLFLFFFSFLEDIVC